MRATLTTAVESLPPLTTAVESRAAARLRLIAVILRCHAVRQGHARRATLRLVASTLEACALDLDDGEG